MKNKQNCYTRIKFKIKLGWEMQGLVLTAQPAFPRILVFLLQSWELSLG